MLDIELLDLTPTPLPQHPLDTLLQKSKMVQEKKKKNATRWGERWHQLLSQEKKNIKMFTQQIGSLGKLM